VHKIPGAFPPASFLQTKQLGICVSEAGEEAHPFQIHENHAGFIGPAQQILPANNYQR